MTNIVFILGMHRSFTSVFTNFLSKTGVNLGNFQNLTSEGENSDGFFENFEIVDFNDQLFESLNLSWDTLSDIRDVDFDFETFKDFYELAKSLLDKQIKNNDSIIIKDPRMCILLPFWLKIIEYYNLGKPYFIHVYRDPKEVISSFERRTELLDEYHFIGNVTGFVEKLYLFHNLQVIRYLDNYNFISIDGNEFITSPKSIFNKLQDYLDFVSLNLDGANGIIKEKEIHAVKKDLEVYITNECESFFQDMRTGNLDIDLKAREAFLSKYEISPKFLEYTLLQSVYFNMYRQLMLSKITEHITYINKLTEVKNHYKSELIKASDYIDLLHKELDKYKN